MTSKKKQAAANLRKHSEGAVVAHVEHRDGNVVALGNLRVLINKQDGSWLAQGLEIDYAIDGQTIAEVKRRFETGLAMTIESHLRIYNSIDNLLQQAPGEVWSDYFAARNQFRRYEYSTLEKFPTLQEHLPFDGIAYYENDVLLPERKRA